MTIDECLPFGRVYVPEWDRSALARRSLRGVRRRLGRRRPENNGPRTDARGETKGAWEQYCPSSGVRALADD